MRVNPRDRVLTFTFIDTAFSVHEGVLRDRLPCIHAAVLGPGHGISEALDALSVNTFWINGVVGTTLFSPTSSEKLVALPAAGFEVLLSWAYTGALASLWAYSADIAFWLTVGHAMSSAQLINQLHAEQFRTKVYKGATALWTGVYAAVLYAAALLPRAARAIFGMIRAIVLFFFAVLFWLMLIWFVGIAVGGAICYLALPAATDFAVAMASAATIPVDAIFDRLLHVGHDLELSYAEKLRAQKEFIAQLPPDLQANLSVAIIAEDLARDQTHAQLVLSVAGILNTADTMIGSIFAGLVEACGSATMVEAIKQRTATYEALAHRATRGASNVNHLYQATRQKTRGIPP
jgi:hypothetical protein